ncbi:DEAD/DEAH box helicase [Arthrobacter sp. BPSS-3]|uniref:DEAD/DEAH box helicase n=1 Tax=Arthrobacter sp. BPSS-3 TaxID=3366580 RepID=UPI0037DD8495
MAATVNELREVLNSPNPIPDPFGLLHSITILTATDGQTPALRELVVRALDKIDQFQKEKPLLMALAREFGLYPYMEQDGLALTDALAVEMHRPDNLDGVVFSSIQAAVYLDLMEGRNVILSAPTSFGKSLIVDALIASGKYDNVVLIVPTIALIDETRRRLSDRQTGHKIYTHPGQAYAERNLFVLTQERYLNLVDPPRPDLFFVDEFYKLDERSGENLSGRAALLNQALYRLMKTGAQFYLAGPNIHELSAMVPTNISRTLRVTDFSTVAANVHRLPSRTADQRKEMVKLLASTLTGGTMIYCGSPKRVRDVVGWLTEDENATYGSGMPDAANWLEHEYSEDWALPKALRKGIGSHHGRLPRWLAHKVVSGFNDGSLGVLVCNNTLIEGVNTTAKNVIVLDRTLARRAYNFFTFMNIRGRGGRMFKHFVGDIFLFHDAPEPEINAVDIPALSQSDDAPTSLLLSMEAQDRSERTNERLSPVLSQRVLSLETMRANQGVSPEAQIELAEHLQQLSLPHIQNLLWNTPYPNGRQSNALMELIWDFIPPDGASRHGAVSAAQLALFTYWVASAEGNLRAVMDKFTQPNPEYDGRETHDDKVDKAFDFIRFWIDHNLPMLIRAVDRIADEVFTRRGITPGKYGGYASRMEDGFQPHLLLTLEEYGIPVQISKKLTRWISGYRTLDELLERIARLPNEALSGLDYFEQETVLATISSLRPDGGDFPLFGWRR